MVETFEQLLDDLTAEPSADGVKRLVGYLVANEPDAGQTLHVHELLRP